MAKNNVYVQGSYVDIHDNEVVSLSIDKRGNVHVEDRIMKAAPVQEKSDKLNSEEASRYWDRLQASGFTDKEHRLLPTTTRKQAMLIAEAFAEKMDIKAKWKVFQQVWGINNLAQEKWEILENGINTLRKDEIEQIFED